MQMNLQLPLVVSDITGVTGLRILRDIIAGRADPQALARHRDYRCRASEEEIAAALTGHYRPEHVFVLKQNLELFEVYQRGLRRRHRGSAPNPRGKRRHPAVPFAGGAVQAQSTR